MLNNNLWQLMLHLKRDSISRTLQQMLLLQCLLFHVIGTTNNKPRKLNLIKSIMSSIKDAFKSILFPIHLKIPYQPIFILPLLQRYFTFNCPMKQYIWSHIYKGKTWWLKMVEINAVRRSDLPLYFLLCTGLSLNTLYTLNSWSFLLYHLPKILQFIIKEHIQNHSSSRFQLNSATC